MIKAVLALAGICLFIGILTIAVFVAGTILGVVFSVLVPIGLLFTGVGLVMFMAKDFSPEKTETKN